MPEKQFKLKANVSSANPAAVKPVLEKMVGAKGTLKATSDGFDVDAEGTTEKYFDYVLKQTRNA